MLMQAEDLSASVLMRSLTQRKGSLPESGKIELMINRSFSTHAALSGEGRTSNCTVRFLQHSAEHPHNNLHFHLDCSLKFAVSYINLHSFLMCAPGGEIFNDAINSDYNDLDCNNWQDFFFFFLSCFYSLTQLNPFVCKINVKLSILVPSFHWKVRFHHRSSLTVLWVTPLSVSPGVAQQNLLRLPRLDSRWYVALLSYTPVLQSLWQDGQLSELLGPQHSAVQTTTNTEWHGHNAMTVTSLAENIRSVSAGEAHRLLFFHLCKGFYSGSEQTQTSISWEKSSFFFHYCGIKQASHSQLLNTTGSQESWFELCGEIWSVLILFLCCFRCFRVWIIFTQKILLVFN